MVYLKKYSRILWILALAGTLFWAGCRKKTDTGAGSVVKTDKQVQVDNGGGKDGDAHGDSAWLTDFEKAKQIAENEGKDLLVDFAGSDWCYWCKKLDAEVFSKDAFIQAVQKDFVLALIDFPSDKSGQNQAIQDQNEKLSNQYAIEGFPTVLLMDAAGKPYAKTGYQEGGPKAYLEHLNDLKKQKAAP